jgi:hypothetical protein
MLPDKGKQEEHPQRQLAGLPEGQSARVSKRKQARPSSSLGSYLAVEEPESIDDRHYSTHAVTKASAVPRHPTINSSAHQVGAGSRNNRAQHVARKPKLFTATTTKNDPNRNGASSQAPARAQAPTAEVKGEKEKESTLQEEGNARHNQSEEVKATKKSSTLGTPRMERESIPGKRMDQVQEH